MTIQPRWSNVCPATAGEPREEIKIKNSYFEDQDVFIFGSIIMIFFFPIDLQEQSVQTLL